MSSKVPSTRRLRHQPIAILAFSVITLTSSAVLYAQFRTFIARDVTTPPPVGKLTLQTVIDPAYCREGSGEPSGTTEMLDGTFVRKDQTIQMDARASLTGACDHYYWDVFWRTEMRYINIVRIFKYPPVGASSNTFIEAALQRQEIDTEVAGTSSGPRYTSLGVVGPHRLTFQTVAHSTLCNILTDGEIAERTLNAVECLPKWNRDPPETGPVDLRRFPLERSRWSILLSWRMR